MFFVASARFLSRIPLLRGVSRPDAVGMGTGCVSLRLRHIPTVPSHSPTCYHTEGNVLVVGSLFIVVLPRIHSNNCRVSDSPLCASQRAGERGCHDASRDGVCLIAPTAHPFASPLPRTHAVAQRGMYWSLACCVSLCCRGLIPPTIGFRIPLCAQANALARGVSRPDAVGIGTGCVSLRLRSRAQYAKSSIFHMLQYSPSRQKIGFRFIHLPLVKSGIC